MVMKIKENLKFLKENGFKTLPNYSILENKAEPFKSVFGYTLRDSEGDFYSDGRLDHVEINTGKDRSGTNWVLTKDGPNASLKFEKGTNYGNKQVSPDKLYIKR